MPQSITLLLKRLWLHIGRRRHWQFGALLIVMLLVSVSEIVSIGAVLPFLGVLTAPEKVFHSSVLLPVISFLNLTNSQELLLPITILFGMASIIAGAMRLLLLWLSTNLSYAVGAELSTSIYRRTLYQPYVVHCARNSSEVIDGIANKTNSVINIIYMVLTLIGSMVILVSILFALIFIDPLVALGAFSGFALTYIVIIYSTRKRLALNSACVAKESTRVIQSLQEGLGGIRDVLIDGTQSMYCQIYSNADLTLRRAQASSTFIGGSPRYVMEALGMFLIAALAYALSQREEGIVKAIPMLGALAMGAQRLLPILQQAYGSWAGIRASQISLQDTLGLLDQPLPSNSARSRSGSLEFKHQICLEDLSFRYGSSASFVINHVNLNIPKGACFGFIGASGGGKSTLLDIVMALLEPTSGVLSVDGNVITSENRQDWQSNIAHVPQTIFLADTTIEGNIAFGVPKEEIDSNRVIWAARHAQIANTIEGWDLQYQTFVGERGIRLSGGQRQRIGIARALYKNASVIIFDEATSALDGETELAVMRSIQEINKGITLLIIAHRLSTLKNCNQIIEIENGCIKNVGSYEEMIIN